MAEERKPEVKKMKQGMCYSCKEKTIIINVFKYFRSEFSQLSISEVVRRTAKATGCSVKSVYHFRKEETSEGGFKAPPVRRIRTKAPCNSRDNKYDDTVRQGIRHIIYDLKRKNVLPSLKTIVKELHANPQLPSLSLGTLRRLMQDMGFVYEKDGNKPVLVEKDDKKQLKSLVDKKHKRDCKSKQLNQETNNLKPIEQKFLPPPPMHMQPEHVAHDIPMYDHPPLNIGTWMHPHPSHGIMKHE